MDSWFSLTPPLSFVPAEAFGAAAAPGVCLWSPAQLAWPGRCGFKFEFKFEIYASVIHVHLSAEFFSNNLNPLAREESITTGAGEQGKASVVRTGSSNFRPPT